MDGQKIAFGNHILIANKLPNGNIHARCIDTCCSGDIRTAIKMREEDFVKLIDTLNYKAAVTKMTRSVSQIRNIVHGPSQEQVEEDPDHSWEKQSLVMEH